MIRTASDEFRERLISAAKDVGRGRIALLLSGGLDSGSVLCAAKHAGLEPDIFTFSLGKYPNKDTVLASHRASTIWPQRPFEWLKVNRSVDEAEAVVNWCIKTGKSYLKAALDCMVVMHPVLSLLADRGYTNILHAMSGGVLWGVSREHSFAARRSHDEWQAMRVAQERNRRVCHPPDAAMLSMRLCEQLGIEWNDPLADIADFMLSLENATLNKPKPKWMAVRAFRELGQTPTITGGLQVVGGSREFTDYAAKTRGFKGKTEWYRALAAQQGYRPRG